MDSLHSITPEDLKLSQDELTNNPQHTVAKNAVTSVGIRTAARVSEQVAQHTSMFDIELSQGDRCDQQRSGRCWMFAGLNCFRYEFIKKHNLKNFEFSQSYPLFYDKLEKSNWFFEQILNTLDLNRKDRVIHYLLTDPVCDGGQWDMFKSLVKKYGVVPKEAMPETACSSDTTQMDAYLTRFLRAGAMQLRNQAKQGKSKEELQHFKKSLMKKVYSLLVTCLGNPPQTFNLRLRDKDSKLVISKAFTPQEFFAFAYPGNIDDMISVISAPTSDKPFYKTYTVKHLGNVVEDGQVLYLNLPIERLKEVSITQLKDEKPVWFGCDVAQSYLMDEGIMDTLALDVDTLFGFAVEGALSRSERLDWGESVMTHAMVFEGVNLDENNKPQLWKVENSWGKDRAKDGFDSMSDAWFNEYVYQVVIDKKYLTEEERAILEQTTPVELAPWDPMGTLA